MRARGIQDERALGHRLGHAERETPDAERRLRERIVGDGRRAILAVERRLTRHDLLRRRQHVILGEVTIGLFEAIGEDTEELPEELHREMRLDADDVEKVAPVEADELAVLERRDGGRARRAADERHLAELLAALELADDL